MKKNVKSNEKMMLKHKNVSEKVKIGALNVCVYTKFIHILYLRIFIWHRNAQHARLSTNVYSNS